MSDEIINIEEYKQVWQVTNSICLRCKNKFVSVHTTDTDPTTLECKKCGEHVTLSVTV